MALTSRARPIYRKDGWVLCFCRTCGRLNYVEPHGTTAKCRCSNEETEHCNLPHGYRDLSATVWRGPNRIAV